MKTIITIVCLTIMAFSVRAQWTNNPALNTGVCVEAEHQKVPAICSDGSGGAIITWADYRNGLPAIYAQKLDANGVAQWATNGVLVYSNYSETPAIISDGAGGAIITWMSVIPGDDNIAAQRINAAGVLQWGINGIVVCSAAGSQKYPQIIADGSNGAIIAWHDNRTIPTSIYTQRLNGSGIQQWTGNGVIIVNSIVFDTDPKLVSDGSNGAVFAWEDMRNATTDIYSQRINASGVIQWAVNGVVVCNATETQFNVQIATDGSGGGIITWEDQRPGFYTDIYAQRILSAGTVQWAANGLLICSAANDQNGPKIIADGAGGVIITWYDFRSGATEYDIFAQKVTAAGAVAWMPNGVAICTESSDQAYPCITKDGSGGAIISWHDLRNGGANTDIYAQRVNSAGIYQWPANGVAICSAANIQDYPEITDNGSGGAIITWPDNRNGSHRDIYTQLVLANGQLSVGTNDIEAESNIAVYPNPNQGTFMIKSKYEKLYVTVSNMLGQVVYYNTLTNTNNKIDISNKPAGIYSMQLASVNEAKHFSVTKKIVLEK